MLTGLVMAQTAPQKKIDLGSIPTNAYWTHAPLAAFSLGSLAVGGVFYTIQNSMTGPKVGFVNSDKSSLNSAMGAAGVTALVAGGAYFYYSHRDTQRPKNWNASVSGGIVPSGEINVSASISLPLSIVTR